MPRKAELTAEQQLWWLGLGAAVLWDDERNNRLDPRMLETFLGHLVDVASTSTCPKLDSAGRRCQLLPGHPSERVKCEGSFFEGIDKEKRKELFLAFAKEYLEYG